MNSVSAREALDRLQAGNERYRHDRHAHPNNDSERRESLTGGQEPFAAVLACADSRVSPSLVFDQGLGDLFVVRVAGNVCDAHALGSLEFAAIYLGVKLIVVMGHGGCGAVSAAVDNVDASGPATNTHIDSIIDTIRPAVRAAAGAEDLLDASIHENARMVAAQIRESEMVMKGLAEKGMQVVPAYYDIESGQVEWLAEAP